jgi:hypothetical protein
MSRFTMIHPSLRPKLQAHSNSHVRAFVLPGNLFSVAIVKITGRPAKTCGRCVERIRTMNNWGWWRCWRNRKTIATWLAEEARARGHSIDETSALDLFKAAFKELRKNRPRAADLQPAGKPSASPLQSR